MLYVMNTKMKRIVCSLHCCTFLLKKGTGSLVIGQVFRNVFGMCVTNT
jgi:hypothetical protein